MAAYLGPTARPAKAWRREFRKDRSMAKTPKAETPAPVAAPAGFPPPETIKVHSRRVACDGVGGALGHPRVWLELGESGVAECGYCDRRFVLAGHERPEDEHSAPGVYEGSSGH
jgi:uncharacterized Zn-finger protein